MFHLFLLAGSKTFQAFPSMGNMVRTFYLKILLPVYFKWISIISKCNFEIVYRHSVLKKNFNPCLSDIDYSILISNPTSEKLDVLVQLLTDQYRIKILDIPQIYLPEEWAELPDIDDDKMKIVRFFWYFRKSKWINTNVLKTSYEIFKKDKSNQAISQEIFKQGIFKDSFTISDINLEVPLNGGPEVCVYSPYLELKDSSRVLICSLNQLEFLLSILPSERMLVEISPEWMEIKKSLWKFEYYVSKSHFRVHSRMGEECGHYESILRYLEDEYEKIFHDKLVACGSQFDYKS